MLKIRLSRAGKKSQPSYRVVVQEHTAPIKGKFVEQLGIYRPTDNPKVFKVDIERVKHWISVGAQPSDRVAVLLKNEGLSGMEKYIDPRNKQRKKKKEVEEEAPAEAPKAEEAPKTEEAPAEAPKEEASPAPTEEAPKAEEAPKTEEAPAEAPKEEASPAPTEETPEEAKEDTKPEEKPE